MIAFQLRCRVPFQRRTAPYNEEAVLLLCRNCQLLNGYSLLKHGHIDLDALLVTVETHLHLRRVAIRFPKSAAGIILPPVFNEPNHIPEGIPQKYTNFMRKFRLSFQAAGQLRQQAVQVRVSISGIPQKFLVRMVCQQLLQMLPPVHIDDYRAVIRAFQKNLNFEAKGR